ncbi:MAG: hypothetical protein F6K50_03970 [Moorea sp. SIO3I7]|nr:hypothetical protein [Moorena sp. SIO3I7]
MFDNNSNKSRTSNRRKEDIIDVESFITDRISQLGSKAASQRGLCDSSKIYGGILSVVSFFALNSIPGGQVVVASSLAGYLLAVYGDYATTKRLRLFPSRRTVSGLSQDKEGNEDDRFIALNEDYEEDISYLGQKEELEAKFINRYFDELCEKLYELPVSDRSNTYQVIIDSVFSRKKQSKYYQYFEARSKQDARFMEAEIAAKEKLLPRKIRQVDIDYLKLEEDQNLFSRQLPGDQDLSQGSELFPVSEPAMTLSQDEPVLTGYQIFYSLIDSTCCYVAGGQQSGKTLLLAETTKRKAEEGILIFYVNWFSTKLDRDGHWEHVPASHKIETDISMLSPEEFMEVINQTLNLLNTFKLLVFGEHHKDCILVWDELEVSADKNSGDVSKATQPVLQLLSDLIGRLTGTGVKNGGSVQVLSPGYAAGSMFAFVNSKAKKMTPIVCSINKGKFVKTRNNKTISFNKSLLRQMANNFVSAVEVDVPIELASTKTERIFQFQEEWVALGDASDLRPCNYVATDDITHQPHNVLAQKKRSQIEELITKLEEDGYETLWSFAEAMEIPSSDAKRRFIEIVSTYLESERPDLASRFARNKEKEFSSFDGRYSYSDNIEKELNTRLLTNFRCCLCQKRSEDVEIHRTSYLGADDQPGKNMFPLCEVCHDEAHEAGNWNSTLDSIWSSHQTEGFTKRINLGLNFLTQDID